jgi:16S rRNA (guanine966-N2)-methyltransferase
VVVVERGTRSENLVWPPGFAGDRARRYGETVLWYGHATTTAE